MANLVESIMDRVKFPDKIELSQADRQLLQKLTSSVEELKSKKTVTDKQLAEAEERLLAQMRLLFEETNEKSAETEQPPEISLDLSELKHFISEENEQRKYQIKSLMEEKNSELTSQLQNLKTSIKDEEILSKIPSLFNQLYDTETNLHRQMRTVKIMMGFTIWTSILTLAVVAAHVLGYI